MRKWPSDSVQRGGPQRQQAPAAPAAAPKRSCRPPPAGGPGHDQAAGDVQHEADDQGAAHACRRRDSARIGCGAWYRRLGGQQPSGPQDRQHSAARRTQHVDQAPQQEAVERQQRAPQPVPEARAATPIGAAGVRSAPAATRLRTAATAAQMHVLPGPVRLPPLTCSRSRQTPRSSRGPGRGRGWNIGGGCSGGRWQRQVAAGCVELSCRSGDALLRPRAPRPQRT